MKKSCAPVFILFCIFISFPLYAWADSKTDAINDYRLQGYQEQLRGNLVAALSLYTKAISLDPNRPDILNDMGVVYESMGIIEQAEKRYLEAISIDNSYLPPYMNLAYLYKKNQDTMKASAYFLKRTLLGNPNDPWTQKAKEELSQMDRIIPFLREHRIEKEADILEKEMTRRIQLEKERRRKEKEQEKKQAQKYLAQAQKLYNRRMYAQAIDFYDDALKLTEGEEKEKIIAAQKAAEYELKKQQLRLSSDKMLKMLNQGDTSSARKEAQRMLSIIPEEQLQTSE